MWPPSGEGLKVPWKRYEQAATCGAWRGLDEPCRAQDIPASLTVEVAAAQRAEEMRNDQGVCVLLH